MLALFLSMIASVGWPGLQQRCFLLMFLAWLCVVANRRVTITAGGVSAGLAAGKPSRLRSGDERTRGSARLPGQGTATSYRVLA